MAFYWQDDHLEGRTVTTMYLQKEGDFVEVLCSWIVSMCLYWDGLEFAFARHH